jgi:hypothetical protein
MRGCRTAPRIFLAARRRRIPLSPASIRRLLKTESKCRRGRGMKTQAMGWLVGAALCATSMQAQAQHRLLQLHEMNFDMWCQEQQHLPPARCDKRLPKDDAAFQAYANTIERYETQKLNGEAQDRRIDRMLDANPANNPTQPSGPSMPSPQQ